MASLSEFLLSRLEDEMISWQVQQEAANRFKLTTSQIEEEILNAGFLPARYQRNCKTISVAEQQLLFRSRVTVIGCGGLGGYVLEELARLGVGQLVAVDHDVFEEHNLNRQLLATISTLGRFKADVAAERIASINPAVEFVPIKEAFARENSERLLAGSQVVVDGLDTIGTRLLLSSVCRELAIPLVHGAICGWFGQVATQFPGEDTLEKLYLRCTEDRGMEKIYGNPSFTPATVASLQAAEVCKILLGRGSLLRKRVLCLNLLAMELDELQL
ncbi:MAG: HesA/MoeB/ThiF family protein [Dethiobacteraceae bacterium]